ncbi:baeRF12 domain-containing protein [Sandarakinorhabdus rubra]|uniref:baeRF12 domain-containing protein n=1 Tax=Sandarakinorhabdus rubra TaxID=2672568 RepID=UPI0013DCF283|nr:host attachment protein [Sandarakinorhabdus rubra]
MHIRHDALILVADGQKYLLLRNQGDFRAPALTVEGGAERKGAPARAMGTDRPGRSFASTGTARSALDETDFAALAEARFAGEAAAALAERANGSSGDIFVAAPPDTLAELRRRYSPAVKARLAGELDKNLTGHTVADIAAILSR